MSIIDIFRIKKIKAQNEELKLQINDAERRINDLGVTEYEETKRKIDELNAKNVEVQKHAKQELDSINNLINDATSEKDTLTNTIENLNNDCLKLQTTINSQNKKLSKIRELYKSMDYTIKKFFDTSPEFFDLKLPQDASNDLDDICPTVTLKLHCMDIKELRKASRDNTKIIDNILKEYSSRYTTKANKAIYELMVIALRSELQNILYNLKYEKLDDAVEQVKSVTTKYLKIAADGNQSIAGTLTKFIGEIEYLFINAVKIEYNYYVKKEQAKQEQLALKQQMREEAEERKLLEQQKKQIEKEEEKYSIEIEKINSLLSASTDDDEISKLNARILELQGKLSDVLIKKDDITKLQNGKAGNVYIISNLGSFGEDVFKIGMTRRINPQDRVDELGSASVPFRFDVHSFIFSDNAVDLESKLHNILNEKRLNKVNLRKEFFKVSLDELEQLVNEIEPTAEFNKTMMAEEFRQSLSTDEVYSNDITDDNDDELEDDEI